MIKKMLVVVSAVMVPCVATAQSFTPPTVSTTEFVATVGVILTALGAIWGLRKVIKLMNRS